MAAHGSITKTPAPMIPEPEPYTAAPEAMMAKITMRESGPNIGWSIFTRRALLRPTSAPIASISIRAWRARGETEERLDLLDA